MANARNRKAKARRITLPGGESAPAPVKVGRPAKEDAARVVIDARLRHHNAIAKPEDRLKDTPDTRRDLRHPMLGCSIGRALLDRKGEDMRDLWGAVCHMRQTFAAYYRASGIPAPHAKVAGILAPTEAMETSANAPPVDLRTDEERARAATGAYMRLQGWLDHTDKAAASSARQAIVFAPDGPIHNLPGIIRSLQCVVDGMAGRPIIWRGAPSS